MADYRKIQLSSSFSLIEMLVVIAIIAILTSMLLPSLQGAISVARSHACQNNMRMCFLAENSYMSDNDGWLYSGWQQTGQGWSASIMGIPSTGFSFSVNYLGDNNSAVCPSFFPYNVDTSDPIHKTYGFNGSFSSFTGECSWINAKNSLNHYIYRFASIKSLSKKILLADSCKLSAGIFTQTSFWQPTYFAWDNGVHLRHSNFSNLLYCDGHVQSLPLENLLDIGFKAFWSQDNEKMQF